MSEWIWEHTSDAFEWPLAIFKCIFTSILVNVLHSLNIRISECVQKCVDWHWASVQLQDSTSLSREQILENTLLASQFETEWRLEKKTWPSARTRGLCSNMEFQPCEPPIRLWFFVSNRCRYGYGWDVMLRPLRTRAWGMICTVVLSGPVYTNPDSVVNALKSIRVDTSTHVIIRST